MNHAGYLKRFAAFFTDWYLASLLAAIPVIIMQSIYGKDLIILNSLEDIPLSYAWTGGILALTVYAFYYCVFPLIPARKDTPGKRKEGQTPGRWLFHIQVTSCNDTPLTIRQLLLRDFVGFLLLQGYLTSANIYILILVQRTFDIYIIPYVQSIYYITSAISLVLLLFGKKKQMLHDKIGNCRMINTVTKE